MKRVREVGGKGVRGLVGNSEAESFYKSACAVGVVGPTAQLGELHLNAARVRVDKQRWG